MARAKPKSAPKAKQRVAKAKPTEFPYLHIGHGSSRCTDDFSIWLLFAEPPDAASRTAIEGAMPQPLRDQARSAGGELSWMGSLLFVNSGMDFKYFIADYDECHLAWVEDRLATGNGLSSDDLDRIAREVMNQDLAGPKNPGRTVWDAYNVDVEVWLAKVAALVRLRLVVKDVTIHDDDATPWHRWSAASSLARLADLPAVLQALPPPPKYSSGYFFVHPLLDAALRVTPAKTLAPEQRDACIALLGLEGSLIEPGLLASLVTSLPAKERAGEVQALLRAHHHAVMGLFTAGATRLLLLDDGVYATAIEHAPHCRVPFYRWLDQRYGIVTLLKRRDSATIEWGKRILALIDANGELGREVRAETESGEPGVIYRSTYKALLALRAELG